MIDNCYAECHLRWVSHINPLYWVSICHYAECRGAICWISVWFQSLGVYSQHYFYVSQKWALLVKSVCPWQGFLVYCNVTQLTGPIGKFQRKWSVVYTALVQFVYETVMLHLHWQHFLSKTCMILCFGSALYLTWAMGHIASHFLVFSNAPKGQNRGWLNLTFRQGLPTLLPSPSRSFTWGQMAQLATNPDLT